MKHSGYAPWLYNIYRFLAALVICLALVILGVTVYSLVFQNEPVPAANNPAEGRMFTGIGRLRLAAGSSDGQGAVVILSITFPYAPEDRPFSEELAARVKDFRSITEDFFKTQSAIDLEKLSDDQIKKTLLERFNKILRLGKISVLYFNDYMILR